jgi:anti-sigma B factor antagonist
MAAGEHELGVAVRRRGEVTVLDLVGDIDRDADAPLQQAYEQAVAAGGSGMLLNFAGVGYINSTGIAVIVGLLARARTERRPITACALSEHYRRIFNITRLSDFIGLYPDEDSAVAGVGGAGAAATTADRDVSATRGGGE